MASTSDLLKIAPKPELYWKAVWISFIPLGIAALLGVIDFLFNITIGIHMGSFAIPYWLLLAVLTSPYYLGSLYLIHSDEFFGAYILEIPTIEGKRGLKYVPLFVGRIARFTRNEQEAQFPGEPEQISSVTDEETTRMRSQLLKPVRITTGGPEQGEDAEVVKDHPMNSSVGFEPTFTVFWQVELDENLADDNEGFFEFADNIPGKTWEQKLLTVLKQMRDTGEEALGEIMGQHSAAWSIVFRAKLAQQVAERIAAEVQKWGIRVCKVGVQNISGSHAVHIALDGIVEADAKAKAMRTTAAGQKDSDILVSEGKKQARINELTGEGEGLKAAAAAAGMEPVDFAGIGIATEVAKHADVILGTDGFKEVMGMGKALLGGKK